MQPTPAKQRSFLPLLLLLTEVAYIATYLTSMGLNGWSFENLKLNPMAGGTANTLRTLGAVDYDKIVYNHQWWRIVAAPFVCSGIHLFWAVVDIHSNHQHAFVTLCPCCF